MSVAWREYAASLPQEEMALSLQMNNMDIDWQEGDNTFYVIVDNPAIMNELNKKSPQINEFLHQRLGNSSVTMAVRMREATDRQRAFSKAEQLNMMLEQSEPLRKLKEEFGLELA